MKTALPRATWYKLNFAHFLAPKTYQGTNNKWPDLCSKNFRDMVTYDFTVKETAENAPENVQKKLILFLCTQWCP